MSDHKNNNDQINENPLHGEHEAGDQDKAPGKRNGEYKGTGPNGNGHDKPGNSVLPTEHPHSFTMLRTIGKADNSKPLLTKTFAQGKFADYDDAKFYSARTIDVTSLAVLYNELVALAAQPKCCFVAGAIIDGSDRNHMRRLKLEHTDKKTGEVAKATLRDVPRHLIPMDLDALACPDGLDRKDLRAVAAYIRSQLPPAFHNVACVAMATSGHLLKDGLRFRMFFLADRPLTCAQIKSWMQHEKAPVDLSIYNPQAVVYTATAIFETPNDDPLPRGRIVQLGGAEHVSTPDADYFAALNKKPSPPRDKKEKVIVEGDWREIQKGLAYIPAEDYEIWLHVGMALHWAQHHSDDQNGTTGFDLWDEWSQSADNYDASVLETKWDTFDPVRGGEHGPITADYIYKLAREYGLKPDDDNPTSPTREMLFKPAHYESAKTFLRRRHWHEGRATLIHHQSVFYNWDQTHYANIPEEQMRSRVWDFLAAATTANAKGDIAPFNPNKGDVANVTEALAARTQLLGNVSFPHWVGEGFAPAHEIVSCANGLLHLPTRRLFPHTPMFRNIFALNYAYEPNAPEPESWMAFLHELWENDQQSIDTLQEIFGYLLTSDTSLQKIAMLIGPKRSGKGTIARILRTLLGEANVSGPTLASLSTQFGLQSLITKTLAIISDARISGKTDVQVIVERLLTISGEDCITVQRKFLGDWDGRLPTRIMILTNVLPKLGDASGAIVSRFVVLKLTKSFYGCEDPGLYDKLLPEMPGILNWSLKGLDRLRKRGHFIMPDTAKETLDTFESLSNPLAPFLEEECVLGNEHKILCDELYGAWQSWCKKQGRDWTGTKQAFGAELHAVIPTLATKPVRLPNNPVPVRFYFGVAKKPM
jgi:P4 family phage/plasmid primase-like protien